MAESLVRSSSGPSLSALMCNYNHAGLVARAIDAIMTQSRPPDELIVLDDASTDDSLEVIERCASRHPAIRVLRHVRNAGVIASVNELLAEAQGDYVFTASADDYILPGFFEQAMQMAERYPQAGVLAGECFVIDPAGVRLATQQHAPWSGSQFVDPVRFLHEYLYATLDVPSHSFVSAIIHRRSALAAVGGFAPELGFWTDTFTFRVLARRHGLCYVDQPCACWTAAPDSFSHRTLRDPAGHLEVLAALVRQMTSPAHSEDFPSDYVSRWSERYRSDIVHAACRQFDARFAALNADLWPRGPGGGPLGPVVGHLLWRLGNLHEALLRAATKRALQRYPRHPPHG
ncbi:MAG: glycosyltransferase family 2 protein [Acidimicrobiia bacterium]|nr:glycosyltransferase family 2 protein [Acidimicrobiia bacterium]